jgi:hypothetical protein
MLITRIKLFHGRREALAILLMNLVFEIPACHFLAIFYAENL